MIDWRTVQTRLGVKADGYAGSQTYTALLSKVADRQVDPAYGAALAVNAPSYGVDCNPQRLAAFVGQTAHESGGYRYTREIWGPTDAQKRYDVRVDLGNKQVGDGYAYRGAGLIQVTGRNWFDRIGHALGLDLIGHPEMSARPTTAVLMSLEWWKAVAMNVLADTGDAVRVSKRVNGGLNGIDERKRLTGLAMEVLS